ncbi:Arc family DNA-binding protein [Xanthobacter sp. TB0139]|uniref:Arc family DNA-binding protein n=1 Tax=Xanthobacter sp. TB0139 TaxID=3459178 RepID=UPI00403A6E3F
MAQMALRMPPDLRESIKAAAKANERTMNSEVIHHLKRIFGSAEAATGAEFGDDTPAAVDPNTAVEAAGQFHTQQKDC